MKATLLTLTALALLAGCSVFDKIGSKGCQDQLNACGQTIIQCTQQAGCDVSACIGDVLPTPAAPVP